MNFAKITLAAAGFGLLAIATLVPAQADRMAMTMAEPSSPLFEGPAPVARVFVSIQPVGEIPLGLLIKTPQTPHGVSFNRQVASLGSTQFPAHG